MGDELVLRGLATAHLLQVSGTIAQRGASWLQRARTGGLVRLDLTANPDKLQGLSGSSPPGTGPPPSPDRGQRLAHPIRARGGLRSDRL